MFCCPMMRVPVYLMILALVVALLPAHAEEPVPADRTLLLVKLPANAALVIGTYTTQQSGPERLFISPALPAGRDFYYTLTATWEENGQQKSAVRQVTVRAGQKFEVDFNQPEAVAKAPPTEPAAPAKTEPAAPAKADAKAPKSRTFLVTYGGTITGLAEDKTARVWLPVATSSDDQEVKIESMEGIPDDRQLNKDPEYGNQILYADLKGDKDGNAKFAITYRVTRHEVKGASPADVPDAALVERYLKPDALVPIDGKPLELIKDKPVPPDQVKAAKMFYDLVNNHMKYDKSKPGYGKGDSNWACDSRFGNCTDFHSLFISLARAAKIPTKFEIGFPLPTKRGEGEIGGYHCWAKFKPDGKGWIPVDISEANKEPKMKDYYFGNLTEDRVTFTTGRDIELVPKADGGPRNFLIYPYVEVDGKEYDKVKRQFSFKDLPAEK